MHANWARKLQVKPGELWLTGVMLLNIFSVLTFYFILKSLRAGFVLSKIPAGYLPYAYILTAMFAGTVSTLVFRLSRRNTAITVLTGTYVSIIATLLALRWAMGRSIDGLPYLYFVYVEIVAVLTTAQFWLLAGYVFDNRQSKRIFPILGSGAIAGAMAGSAIPGFLSGVLSTQSMLVICIAACAAIVALSNVAWRYRRAELDRPALAARFGEPHESAASLLRIVFASRHVTLIVLLVLFGVIAGQIAEWQVYSAGQQRYEYLPADQQEKAINQLLGRFYFVVNVLGITLQLTLGGYILRRFGVGHAILLLPTGVCAASIGVAVAPLLPTALLAFGANSLLRHSINRVALELLYLPLPPRVRRRIKFFVDVFVDRSGCAVAAIIILALTGPHLALGLRGTGVATVIVTAAGLIAAWQARKSYLDSFRQRLAVREVDMSELQRHMTDPASVAMLVGCLESANERQIVYGLRLLQAVRGVDFSEQLLPLLQHGSERVRCEAVTTLAALPGRHERLAQDMLHDPSRLVRAAAVDYLYAVNPAGASEQMYSILPEADADLKLAIARKIAEFKDAALPVGLDLIDRLLQAQGPESAEVHEAAAWLASRLPSGDSMRILRDLLRDPRPAVAGAAARAAGLAGHVDLLFDILPLLTQRRLKGAAQEALTRLGPRITGTLADVLADSKRDPALRREIPRVLSQLVTARSADALIASLGTEDAVVKYQVVRALDRLHERDPGLPEPNPLIAERIYVETKAYYEALVICQSLNVQGCGDRSLLGRALRERLDQNLEIIFRLLGLQYPQKDIFSAYAALKGDRAERRASAIEFLDNLLNQNLKSVILPLLEESSTEMLIDRASRLFGVEKHEPTDALRMILRQTDAWLRACALFEIGSRRMSGMDDECRALSQDGDPIVRETAEWALRQCA